MDTTHCIDNTTWELYAAKTLGAKELEALQKHVATCELCSDIKEGIDAMAKPDTLAEQVSRLNERVDEYTKRKTNRIPLWYWSAAAVLLLSLGLGWYFTNTESKGVAINTVEQETENSADTNTNSVEKGTDVKGEGKSQSQTEEPTKQAVKQNENTFPQKESVGNNTQATAQEEPQQGVSDKEQRKNIEQGVDEGAVLIDTATRGKLADASLLLDGVAVKKSVTKTERSLPSPVTNNLFNNNFNNNNGINNIGFIWSLDSVNYKFAQTYLTQDSLQKCITALKDILNNKSSLYYERAVLLKAKARIKQGKKRKARKLLKEVIELKGTYKAEAEKLLKQIQ